MEAMIEEGRIRKLAFVEKKLARCGDCLNEAIQDTPISRSLILSSLTLQKFQGSSPPPATALGVWSIVLSVCFSLPCIETTNPPER